MSRPVISADDVRAARRRGEQRLIYPVDAIVTPLAHDEAARTGIDLIAETDVPPAPAAAASTAHLPTCDDPENALETVVAMVRVRVPEADPVRIREIARRVLERIER